MLRSAPNLLRVMSRHLPAIFPLTLPLALEIRGDLEGWGRQFMWAYCVWVN